MDESCDDEWQVISALDEKELSQGSLAFVHATVSERGWLHSHLARRSDLFSYQGECLDSILQLVLFDHTIHVLSLYTIDLFSHYTVDRFADILLSVQQVIVTLSIGSLKKPDGDICHVRP